MVKGVEKHCQRYAPLSLDAAYAAFTHGFYSKLSRIVPNLGSQFHLTTTVYVSLNTSKVDSINCKTL